MQPLGVPEERVGPYRLLAELGSGGMGRVYLASAPDGGLVAVKRIDPRFAGDTGFRARFAREVDACRRVSGAYTAAVIAADPEAPTPWLASVYVPGPSLAEAIEESGPLPEESAVQLAARLATALGDIHRAGLVHRDLKPSNVLLADDGLRVIDFGIVRAVDTGDTEATLTALPLGSPSYMSPEQALARPVTAASDVFSLGTILVVASTGRNPFAVASDLQATLNAIINAQPDLSLVPPRLRQVVARCLAKDPAARPAPAQLLEAIAPIAPTPRPWPAAVYDQIARRRADLDRLLATSQPSPNAPRSRPPADATRQFPRPEALATQEIPAPRRKTGVPLWIWAAGAALAIAAVLGVAVAWDLITEEGAASSRQPAPSPSAHHQPSRHPPRPPHRRRHQRPRRRPRPSHRPAASSAMAPSASTSRASRRPTARRSRSTPAMAASTSNGRSTPTAHCARCTNASTSPRAASTTARRSSSTNATEPAPSSGSPRTASWSTSSPASASI